MRTCFNRSKISSQFIKFCVVGLIATGIHYGVYILLLTFITVKFAYSVGYLAGFLFNLMLSANFTFKSKVNIKKTLGFIITNAINYGLHMLFLNIVLSLDASEKIAPVFVFAIVVPINFILVRFVFNSKIFQ